MFFGVDIDLSVGSSAFLLSLFINLTTIKIVNPTIKKSKKVSTNCPYLMATSSIKNTPSLLVWDSLSIIFLLSKFIPFESKERGGNKTFFTNASITLLKEAPIIIPIEIISYLSRPVALSVRLMANMLAGHSIIKIFAGFIVMMGFFGIIPLAGLVAIYALETFIAFLQAYIFTILTCIYLNDALHPHH